MIMVIRSSWCLTSRVLTWHIRVLWSCKSLLGVTNKWLLFIYHVVCVVPESVEILQCICKILPSAVLDRCPERSLKCTGLFMASLRFPLPSLMLIAVNHYSIYNFVKAGLHVLISEKFNCKQWSFKILTPPVSLQVISEQVRQGGVSSCVSVKFLSKGIVLMVSGYWGSFFNECKTSITSGWVYTNPDKF